MGTGLRYRDGKSTRATANSRMIAQVWIELDKAPPDRDIAVVTRATLMGLGEQPRSAHALGVADAPIREMVRTARRELGLPEKDEIEVPELTLRHLCTLVQGSVAGAQPASG